MLYGRHVECGLEKRDSLSFWHRRMLCCSKNDAKTFGCCFLSNATIRFVVVGTWLNPKLLLLYVCVPRWLYSAYSHGIFVITWNNNPLTNTSPSFYTKTSGGMVFNKATCGVKIKHRSLLRDIGLAWFHIPCCKFFLHTLKTNHVEIDFHFVRDTHVNKISISFTPLESQLADDAPLPRPSNLGGDITAIT